MLEVLVEVRLSRHDLLAASSAADDLAAVAALGGREADVARAHLSHGRLALAAGDVDKAQSHLESALEGFVRLGLPFERSWTRLELSRAKATANPKAAIAEARVAHEQFERLGACRHADMAAALVRSLGGRPTTGPRARGPLTAREAEVFRLLGLGLSNPEIAARLYISRKTVEHHVGKVLAKLGLRSRAEVAARAAAEVQAGRPLPYGGSPMP
ncbi:MAG: LuxR C-terminal-related transcriptional regulator [Acidimicrobiales bacterium]